MASTESDSGRRTDAAPDQIRPLTTADLRGALALSESANWNQNEADWRMMLRIGRGWGIHAAAADGTDTLAASTLIIPYGAGFAWISMVLVLPEFQRRGLASKLLRHALDTLAAESRIAVLDATPAGRTVYVQEGFHDAWRFARCRREAPTDTTRPDRPSGPATRSLVESDWPAIEAWDESAFGASRADLLRSMAQRLPQAARVVMVDGNLRGFIVGRDGREAAQLGPLLAADQSSAISLVADALRTLNGPVYVDLLDERPQLQGWLLDHGFKLQRAFTRMVRGGPGSPPGDPQQVMLVAGPELG